MPLKISIVTPFFNESSGLDAYFLAVEKVLDQMDEDYEIICIEDGSADLTYETLLKHRSRNPRIKVVKLSRNFGKEAALTAGIDFIEGDAAIFLDADLQDPPELIPRMVDKWLSGYSVVLMRRKHREEGLLKKTTANLFYTLMTRLSKSEIPEDVGDFRLMDRRALEVVKRMPEKARFMKGILSWAGFKCYTLEFERPDRQIGNPKQSYRKLFSLAFSGIFSFSVAPIRLWIIMGLSISMVVFLFGIYLIIQILFYGITVPGYASTMVVILFLGGVQLISLGVIGEYIGLIFNEVKNRPTYVVEEENL